MPYQPNPDTNSFDRLHPLSSGSVTIPVSSGGTVTITGTGVTATGSSSNAAQATAAGVVATVGDAATSAITTVRPYLGLVLLLLVAWFGFKAFKKLK